MKIPRILCAVLLLAVTHQALATANFQKLDELYGTKKYFELRDALRDYERDQSPEILFYRGAVSNKFNRPQASISFLTKYLEQSRQNVDREFWIESLEMLADNYRKTYQYRKAADTYRDLLTRFRNDLGGKKKDNYENELKLWSALARVPSQTTSFDGDSLIEQNAEGNLPVEINNLKVALGFDSGANISVVTESLARKASLEIIEAQIDVGAIAGNKVIARLAVAPTLKIGKVTVRNAVFLVLADRDLYIEKAKLQIDGVIGFPVIESLRQLTFLRGRGVAIPASPGVNGEQNLCLDGLSPVIAGNFKSERLTFVLDTGANQSTLYPLFYQKYEREIRSLFEGHAEHVAGAGGFREVRSYKGIGIAVSFGEKKALFEQISILTEYTTDTSRYFYGNLGMDMVGQFDRMTMNFDRMSVVFE